MTNARSECEESTHDARLCAKQPLRSHSLWSTRSFCLPSSPLQPLVRSRHNGNVSMLLLWHFAAMAINAEVISGVFFWHFARGQGIGLLAPTFSSASATSLHTLLSACLRPYPHTRLSTCLAIGSSSGACVCVSGAGVCVSGACAYVRDAHVHLRLTDKFSRTSQVVHTQTNTLTPTNTHTRTWLPDISR